MKQIVLALILLTSFSAQARPNFHRENHSRRPVVIHKNQSHHSGNDWLGPALIFGATVATISVLSRPSTERVVIVEKTPVYRTKEIREEIKGKIAFSWSSAERNWEKACESWKEDLDEDYRVQEVSCGTMKCVKSHNTYCYSQASAEVVR